MTDPVIDEIRRVRHLISAEMQHDPSKIVEYYRHAETLFSRPALNQANRRTKDCTEADDQPRADGSSVPSGWLNRTVRRIDD